MTDQEQDNFDEGQEPVAAAIREEMLWVTLRDGRVIGTPVNWYPRLASASPEQLANFELWAFGIHWPDLDEDLGIEGMLAGIRPRPSQAAQGAKVG